MVRKASDGTKMESGQFRTIGKGSVVRSMVRGDRGCERAEEEHPEQGCVNFNSVPKRVSGRRTNTRGWLEL